MTNVTATTPPADDLRSIKGPERLPGELAWMWWTLAGVVLATALAAWWWRRRRPLVPASLVPVVPPHVRARQKLAEALLFISDPDRFCTAVSNTLRVYLEERFQLHAPDRTTEEFLVELQASPALNNEQKQSLREFLQSCDLVKFARFEPTETALRELHASALRLVDETQFDFRALASDSSSPSASSGSSGPPAFSNPGATAPKASAPTADTSARP